jgi:hypothetical protein
MSNFEFLQRVDVIRDSFEDFRTKIKKLPACVHHNFMRHPESLTHIDELYYITRVLLEVDSVSILEPLLSKITKNIRAELFRYTVVEKGDCVVALYLAKILHSKRETLNRQ